MSDGCSDGVRTSGHAGVIRLAVELHEAQPEMSIAGALTLARHLLGRGSQQSPAHTSAGFDEDRATSSSCKRVPAGPGVEGGGVPG